MDSISCIVLQINIKLINRFHFMTLVNCDCLSFIHSDSHSQDSSGSRRLNQRRHNKGWKHICLQFKVLTINTTFKLLQHKWLMRTCITPCKIRSSSNMNVKKTNKHCISVLLSNIFWKKVIFYVSHIVNYDLLLCPLVYFLLCVTC